MWMTISYGPFASTASTNFQAALPDVAILPQRWSDGGSPIIAALKTPPVFGLSWASTGLTASIDSVRARARAADRIICVLPSLRAVGGEAWYHPLTRPVKA